MTPPKKTTKAKESTKKTTPKNVEEKEVKKEENKQKEKPSTKYESIPNQEKIEIISRNLLRLYQYVSENHPIEQEDLLDDLEMDTPNGNLRNKLNNAKLELESVYEENQALRENALHSQVEIEDQISSYQMEIDDLTVKVKNSEKVLQEKLHEKVEEYEAKISNLRAELNQAKEKNQKITEVNDAIDMLQEKAKELFKKKEDLIKKNRALANQLEEKERSITEFENEKDTLFKKQQELTKKIELQTMVIEGYKRKERK